MVEYRDITGFPGYRVGNDGTVWSSKRGTWKKLSPGKLTLGYLRVVLYKNGLMKSILVHCLVMEAFVGPRPKGMECRHLDGDPGNNQLENLKWGTQQDNMKDRDRHGSTAKGERAGRCKLTDRQVSEIRQRVANGELQYSLAKEFGVHQNHVNLIVNGKSRVP